MITNKPNRGDPIIENVQATEMLNNWMEDVTNQLNANNYSAVSNPTVNDDQKKGYTIGSEWLNTATGKWYKCRSSALGAAVWDLLN